jgi:hypothetical protein
MDIKKIPIGELREDLNETYGDILTCEAAMKRGIVTYSGGSVLGRLKVNRQIARAIEDELARRGTASATLVHSPTKVRHS